MPDSSNLSPGANGGRIDLSTAPGADMDWDSLFPNPENPTALQAQPASTGTTPQQSSEPAPQAPFLKAGSTVYNTAEDAINGTVHKDDLIAKYRSFLADNGVDPNTLQRAPIAAQQQPQTAPQSTNSQYKYYGNPNFFEEVSVAATNRDKVKYEQLMAAHAREAAQSALTDMLEPWKATLAETNRFKAIRQTASEISNFREFVEGPGYNEVLSKFPLYKDMVAIGENDPVAAQRLPEVYKSMYMIYQGMNQSRTQPQSTTSTTPTTPTVRSQPTLQHSSLTPPAPVNTSGWAESSWRGNKSLGNEARKQLIQDGNAKFGNMKFEDAGL